MQDANSEYHGVDSASIDAAIDVPDSILTISRHASRIWYGLRLLHEEACAVTVRDDASPQVRCKMKLLAI